MNEYKVMKAMLKRVLGNDEDAWTYDDHEHKIWLHCFDDWYTRVFTFNENGTLIDYE